MNPNIRKPEEQQAAFRARRRLEARMEKARLRGRVVWDSAKLGTYVKAKHGALCVQFDGK